MTASGVTTTTVSILGVEDLVSTSASGQTTTDATGFYSLPGGVQATRDSSGLTYLETDQLGTPIAALSLTSGVVGEQLRTPYGQARYSAAAATGGGLHTPFGFTGQREDTTPAGRGSAARRMRASEPNEPEGSP